MPVVVIPALEQDPFFVERVCYEGDRRLDMLFVDGRGKGCEWYTRGQNYLSCGNNDTVMFQARSMCCACGGGNDAPVSGGSDTPVMIDCIERSFGAKDNGGDSCDWYQRSEINKSYCGAYDDADFEAAYMCCACGGGDVRPAQRGPLDVLPEIIVDTGLIIEPRPGG